MIDTMELLQQLVHRVQDMVNYKENHVDISLEYGLKQEGYWLPITHAIAQDELSWHLEIWVNKKCVFRETFAMPSGESIDEIAIKESLAQRVLCSICAMGITQTYQIILENDVQSAG